MDRVIFFCKERMFKLIYYHCIFKKIDTSPIKNNDERFKKAYSNTSTGKILNENKVDYQLHHFILKISQPIFERDIENSNNRTFDFIRCYVSIPTKESFPERNQFIKKHKKDIIKLVIYKIKNSKKFQYYNIPINFLKIDHIIITNQNEIEILFSLKEI